MKSLEIKRKINAVEQNLRPRVLIKDKSESKFHLEDQMLRYKVPGVSIAVINNGKIEWTKEYGLVSNIEKHPIRRNTLFQVGSISKAIAGFAALLLVQNDRLVLDCDVNEYLKTWKIPKNIFTKTEKVTLRRLLSHSAGLSVCGFLGYQNEALPTLIEILDGQKPANTQPVRVQKIPGSKWDYSGGGTTIVQLLIEEITQTPYSKWVSENIFSELDMEDSVFSLSETRTEFTASGHNSEGMPIKGKWRIYPELAAAGLWSTPTDLAKFILNIQKTLAGVNNSLLNLTSIQEMLKPQIAAPGRKFAGLGLFLQKKAEENTHANIDHLYPMFEHNGQTEGFIARIYGLTNAEQGVAITMNAQSNGWHLMDELTHSIADVYGWPTLRPTTKTVNPGKLNLYEKLIGTYRSLKDNQGYSLMSIDIIDNKLFLKAHQDMLAMELHSETPLQYFTQEGNQILQFISSEGNNIDKFIFVDVDKSAFLSFGDEVEYVRVPSATI